MKSFKLDIKFNWELLASSTKVILRRKLLWFPYILYNNERYWKLLLEILYWKYTQSAVNFQIFKWHNCSMDFINDKKNTFLTAFIVKWKTNGWHVWNTAFRRYRRPHTHTTIIPPLVFWILYCYWRDTAKKTKSVVVCCWRTTNVRASDTCWWWVILCLCELLYLQ